MNSKSDVQKAKEALEKKLATNPPSSPEPTGACVYEAGGKVHCAVLTKAACNGLKGTWFEGKPCT